MVPKIKEWLDINISKEDISKIMYDDYCIQVWCSTEIDDEIQNRIFKPVEQTDKIEKINDNKDRQDKLERKGFLPPINPGN